MSSFSTPPSVAFALSTTNFDPAALSVYTPYCLVSPQVSDMITPPATVGNDVSLFCCGALSRGVAVRGIDSWPLAPRTRGASTASDGFAVWLTSRVSSFCLGCIRRASWAVDAMPTARPRTRIDVRNILWFMTVSF